MIFILKGSKLKLQVKGLLPFFIFYLKAPLRNTIICVWKIGLKYMSSFACSALDVLSVFAKPRTKQIQLDTGVMMPLFTNMVVKSPGMQASVLVFSLVWFAADTWIWVLHASVQCFWHPTKTSCDAILLVFSAWNTFALCKLNIHLAAEGRRRRCCEGDRKASWGRIQWEVEREYFNVLQ